MTDSYSCVVLCVVLCCLCCVVLCLLCCVVLCCVVLCCVVFWNDNRRDMALSEIWAKRRQPRNVISSKNKNFIFSRRNLPFLGIWVSPF